MFKSTNVNFYGNTTVNGSQLTLRDLLEHHDIVVIATGMRRSRQLEIPGIHLRNCTTADEMVAWYTSDPLGRGVDFDLCNVRDIAIIGHGNVALDIARLFLKSPNDLARFPINPSFLSQLQSSNIRNVDIIGRRGPLQVSGLFLEFGSRSFRCLSQFLNSERF